MSRIRGISEKIVYAYNPLPEDITEKEMLDECGLDMIEPISNPRVHVFEQPWRYGGTLQREHVVIKPGRFLALRESESLEFLTDCREVGMVVVEEPNDRREVVEQSIKGLTIAVKFWLERGKKKIFEFRKNHGISKDDLEDHKYDLWVYYLNEVKANVCKAELDLLKIEKARLDKLAAELAAEEAEQE